MGFFSFNKAKIKPKPIQAIVLTPAEIEEDRSIKTRIIWYLVIAFFLFFLGIGLDVFKADIKVFNGSQKLEEKFWEFLAQLFTHIGLGFFIASLVDIGTHRAFKKNILDRISGLFDDRLPKHLSRIIGAGITDCVTLSGNTIEAEFAQYLVNTNHPILKIKCLVVFLKASDNWYTVFENLIIHQDCEVEIVLPSYKLLMSKLFKYRSQSVFADENRMLQLHKESIEAIQGIIEKLQKTDPGKAKNLVVKFHNCYTTFPEFYFADTWYKGYYFPDTSGDDEFFLKASNNAKLSKRLEQSYDCIASPAVLQLNTPDTLSPPKIAKGEFKHLDIINKANSVLKSRTYNDAFLESLIIKHPNCFHIIKDSLGGIYGYVLIVPLKKESIKELKPRIKHTIDFSAPKGEWESCEHFVIEQLFVYDEYYQESEDMLNWVIPQMGDALESLFANRNRSSIFIYGYRVKSDIRNEILELTKEKKIHGASTPGVYKYRLDELIAGFGSKKK